MGFQKLFIKQKKMLRSLALKYDTWLKTKPLLSRRITGGILMCTGDFLAQTVFESRGFGRPKQYDWVRSGRLSMIGIFLVSPGIYCWYMKGMPHILNLALVKSRTDIQKTLLLTFIDQTAWALPFTCCF